ncbi:hypothetical protein BHM03_00050687 [Ensete ventricosum]|nr:hypothetical protein BHM03_00050687 [Ensete ventricosum]
MQGRPPMARPWPRPPARGRLAATRASPKGRPVAPAKGANCRVPTGAIARGQPCRQ